MIYFQSKPDAVFSTILEEALDSELLEIQQLADDAAIDSWEGLYPHTSTCFPPYAVMQIMKQLLAASADSQIYQIPEAYWLVLYECLKNFASTHNDLIEDEPSGLRAVGTYKLGVLDNEAMVKIYFWDTDFLFTQAPPESPENLKTSREEGDEPRSEDRWLDDEEEEAPQFEIVREVAWQVPQPDAYFRQGSIEYPDCE